MRRSILLLLAAAVAAGSARAAAQVVRPVVDARDGYLLGVVVNGAWRDAEHGAPMVRNRERYRVFAGGRAVGVAIGARPEPGDGPCEDTRFVKLTPEVEDADVAVVDGWEVRPRSVTPGDAANPAYAADVTRLARAHGIANPEVRITRVVRADLDGDGTEEAIVSATRAEEQLGWAARAGDYSMVFVRKLVRGMVRTIVLVETYHPRSSPTAVPSVYDLGGVYDLDGDGTYEIVLRGRYYEGGSTEVFKIRGTTAAAVAGNGCGA